MGGRLDPDKVKISDNDDFKNSADDDDSDENKGGEKVKVKADEG